jgi:hypothetical protein
VPGATHIDSVSFFSQRWGEKNICRKKSALDLDILELENFVQKTSHLTYRLRDPLKNTYIQCSFFCKKRRRKKVPELTSC